jgi:hypothetical protein
MSHEKRKPTPYCLKGHYPMVVFDSFCFDSRQKATDGIGFGVVEITHLDTLHHLFNTSVH